MSDYTTLLDAVTATTTSSAIQWSPGHATIFISGTFANGDDDDDDDDNGNIVTIEGSADGTTFVPVDELRSVTRPTAKYFRVTGHSYLRATFTKGTGSPTITVRIM